MSWLYGQTWLWYFIAFLVGLFLAWLFLVRPQQRRLATGGSRTDAPRDVDSGTATTDDRTARIPASAGTARLATATPRASDAGHHPASGAVDFAKTPETRTSRVPDSEETTDDQRPASDGEHVAAAAPAAAAASARDGHATSSAADDDRTEDLRHAPAVSDERAAAAGDAPVEERAEDQRSGSEAATEERTAAAATGSVAEPAPDLDRTSSAADDQTADLRRAPDASDARTGPARAAAAAGDGGATAAGAAAGITAATVGAAAAVGAGVGEVADDGHRSTSDAEDGSTAVAAPATGVVAEPTRGRHEGPSEPDEPTEDQRPTSDPSGAGTSPAVRADAAPERTDDGYGASSRPDDRTEISPERATGEATTPHGVEERTDDLRPAPEGIDAPTDDLRRAPDDDPTRSFVAPTTGAADPPTDWLPVVDSPTETFAATDPDAPTEVFPAVDPALNTLDTATITSADPPQPRTLNGLSARGQRPDDAATIPPHRADPTDEATVAAPVTAETADAGTTRTFAGATRISPTGGRTEDAASGPSTTEDEPTTDLTPDANGPDRT